MAMPPPLIGKQAIIRWKFMAMRRTINSRLEAGVCCNPDGHSFQSALLAARQPWSYLLVLITAGRRRRSELSLTKTGTNADCQSSLSLPTTLLTLQPFAG